MGISSGCYPVEPLPTVGRLHAPQPPALLRGSAPARRRACREAGIECPSNTFVGSDEALLDFIIDLNMHRRHLDESQRAMAAARIATLRREDTLKQNQHPDASIEATTQDAAAQRLNVSRSAVQRARVVLDNAEPEVIKLAVSAALAAR